MLFCNILFFGPVITLNPVEHGSLQDILTAKLKDARASWENILPAFSESYMLKYISKYYH